MLHTYDLNSKPDLKKELGKRLRKTREDKKLSRATLGEKAGGIAPSTIQDIEGGDSDASWTHVVALADGLETPLSQLMAGLTKVEIAEKAAKKRSELFLALVEVALKLENNALATLLAVAEAKIGETDSKSVSVLKKPK